MVDVDQQVAHWRAGAQEDWGVAVELVERRRIRHGLFFAQLAIEKALKAHVCRRTQDLAPRLHNLVRLAELAGLQPDESQLSTLADLNAFSQAGRYPDAMGPLPAPEEADAYIQRAQEVFRWLITAF
ncbi:MAG: HEPN domain-containing protein [Vicinamibacterales bacterium]|nr:HEPN domain-containing protein [Vicinamibacterales bacterium]